jgi:hypothetical protein
MRIPVKRHELTSIGYEGYYVEAPRSVKEGWLADLQRDMRGKDMKADPDLGRSQNMKVLELVTDWNLTDDDEHPLPLIRSLSSHEEKMAVMGEIPIEIVVHVVQSIVGGGLPENVKDFSNGS